MSKAPAASKQSSRWGSFLQQAVAGVESRLDTILADGDEAPPASKKLDYKGQPSAREALALQGPAKSRADSLSRSASNGRNNDRLQGRLAKALGSSNSVRRSDSPASISDFSTRTAESPRTSLDTKGEDAEITPSGPSHHFSRGSGEAAELAAERSSEAREVERLKSHANPTTISISSTSELTTSPRPSVEIHSEPSSRQSSEIARLEDVPRGTHMTSLSTEGPIHTEKSSEEYETTIAQLQSDYKVSETRRQEETHTFIERIDALQSKLQYLTKEAEASAKAAIIAAPVGSLNRSLAEKDQQIALLMEEGAKLSKVELRHMNTIKKLRTSILHDQRRAEEARKEIDAARQAVQEAKDKCKRAEEAERRGIEKIKPLSLMERDYEALKFEFDSQNATVIDLRTQLVQATSKAKATNTKALSDVLDAEKKVSAKLRDDLARATAERDASEGKLGSEIRSMKDEAERERARASVTETELRREQSVLESRLEVLHAQAEEVSTGRTGDAQAKLLRQIEVLQTQYAIASDNWRGIEGSLLSRIKSLEEEREDVGRREGDLRRKARELNSKIRKTEEELELACGRRDNIEREFTEQGSELRTTQERLRLSEATLANMREDFGKERASWEATLAQRVEDERSKLRPETSQMPPTAFPQPTTRSPGPHTRKSSTTDLLSLQNRRQNNQAESLYVANSALDRSPSRRASNQILQTQHIGAPQRQDSLAIIPQHLVNGRVPDTPSIHTSDQDDFFEGATSPVSAHRTINDMISVSTAGAGPSVQLVERMSAAVRRLESEKAASRDELARLSAQRDEAREQVVSLMREAEQKRAADIRIKKLEDEIAEINQRYQTTLEMLGEKSELVEELKADVADVKKIYRELVDSTM